MKLITSNPQNATQALGYAIDMAIIENTQRHKGNINETRIVDMLNSFTVCKRIVITYDYVPYEFLFRDERETLKSLYQILGWVTAEGDSNLGMYVEKFIKNGFLCHDENGYETTMTFHND